MSLLSLASAWVNRGRKWLIAAAALVGVYTLLGFLVLPAVVQAKLPPRLGALLQREVQLRRVRANPFTLSLTLEGLQVKDRDGTAFAGWERLYVNVQAGSLFGRSLDFKAIELAEPYGRVVVDKDGRLNFSDILDRLGQASGVPAEPAAPREVAIGHLLISRAQLALRDHSPAEPFATTLGPLTIELKGFRTAYDRRNPYAFSGHTEAGERFAWNGTFSLRPLQSEGTLALENLRLPKYGPYLQDLVAFRFQDGRATARASYAFAWGEGRHRASLQQGTVELQDLRISAQDSPAVRVSLPRVALRGLEADLLESRVEVASLQLADGNLEVARGADGTIDLVRLFTPRPRPPAADAKPLALRLQELALENFRVKLEERATPRPVSLELDQARLRLRGFDLAPDTEVQLDFEGRVNGRGRLKAEGRAALLKPTADLALTATGLDLPAFDAYLEPALDLRVNRGTLNLDGRFRGAFAGRPTDFLGFRGTLRLDGFEAMDGPRQEVFLRYKSLRLNGLDVRTAPDVLSIQAMELVEPEHRLVVAEDGSTNVARALKLQPATGSAAGAVPPTPQAPQGAPFAVSIGRIALRGGRLAFIDRSLEPNAALLISELEGTYTGLSTRPEAQSAVDLKGRAGGLAPILIRGRATPLRHDLDTDVQLTIQGAELSDFSPYAGKYLGYAVRKGKLDVDARLRIQQRRLQVEDKVRLDQFYLGDRMESPDATRLPVKLALALLRDRKGVMELELPVDGSLDDPDFHYGKVVWKAIVNVLGKIATSPFTLLGKLFGGGERDLSLVAFEPGHAEPDAAAAGTLEVLRKALAERPELTLEVEATADPGADVAALKKQALERALREAKARSLRKGQPDLDAEAVVVAPTERETWLRAAFEAAFPAPPPKEKGQPPPPDPPTAELEQRLLGSFPVSAGDLKQLADARAKAVVKLLLRTGQVEPARIFETEGGARARQEGGSRAYFTLK